MKTFIIEEVTDWKWKDEVKSPNVWRKDEFVRTKTKKGVLAAIEFLMSKAKGLTYTITVFRDNEYFTYFRHSMPCLGGLVKYRDSHGERYKNNPYFPRDIYVAFPEGEITYIGMYREGIKDFVKTPYGEFILSEESPWISAFGDKKTITIKDNYFILKNMKSDPTVFYSLMRFGGMNGSVYDMGMGGESIHPKAQILLQKTSQGDPRRLAGQCPIKTSAGSWEEGFGYTRPRNESIFKTELPDKSLENFDDFPTNAYPNTFPFTNEYFALEMKNVFDVDIKNIQNPDEKMCEILVKAWDHFKNESVKLGDGFAK